MYFTGTLSIDPSQITEIQRVKPSKAFGKLFYYLSAGLAADKREVETFTAVSVLQQLNMAMRSVGIDNIIRLARDGEDLYLDTAGRTDDLKEAMQAFADKSPAQEGQGFSLLQLVLEHDDEVFKYLIDLRVRREHAVGVYPISLRINGVLKDMRASAGSTAEQVKHKLAPVFSSQAAYDDFVSKKREHFDGFVARLATALESTIHCDHVERDVASNVIRPRGKKKRPEDLEYDHRNPDVEPLHGGYPGFGEFFFYSWLWSEMSHDAGMELSNLTVVDEGGHSMFDIGDGAVNAGTGGAFDPEADFSAPVGGEVEYHDGHSYESDFTSAALLDSPDTSSVSVDSGATDSGGGGWLGSLFDGGSSDGGGWFDSSGSSCGSSCGGGCGGCGGGD